MTRHAIYICSTMTYWSCSYLAKYTDYRAPYSVALSVRTHFSLTALSCSKFLRLPWIHGTRENIQSIMSLNLININSSTYLSYRDCCFLGTQNKFSWGLNKSHKVTAPSMAVEPHKSDIKIWGFPSSTETSIQGSLNFFLWAIYNTHYLKIYKPQPVALLILSNLYF